MSTARTKSRRRITRQHAIQQYESARRVLATDAQSTHPNQSEEDTVEATSKSNIRQQYRDIVKFLIARSDEVVTAEDYLNWSERDTSLEFTSAKQVHDRYYQLGLAVLPIPKRRGGLHEDDLVATLAAGGAFYRVGDHNRSGAWTYDTSASFGSYRKRVSLKGGNTLDHNPTSVVRAHLIPSQGGPAWPDALDFTTPDAVAAADAEKAALLAEEERQVAEAVQRGLATPVPEANEVLSTPNGEPLAVHREVPNGVAWDATVRVTTPEWEVIGADPEVHGTVVLRSRGGTVLVASVTSIVG